MDSKIADPGVAVLPSRGLSVAHRLGTLGSSGSGLSLADTRGPAAGHLRDAIFRRSLLVADVFAISGAFLLTIAIATRSLQLTWVGIAALPILLVCAKVFGLYDRDETLLHKTTLDEAPKLFHVATLCALVAWLAGGLIVEGTLNRREALFLWLALAVLLMLMRTAARSDRAARGARWSAVCSSATRMPRRRSAPSSAITAGSAPASWRTSTSTRSRRGPPTRARATKSGGGPRAGPRSGHPPRDRRAEQRGRGRGAQPRAHAEGGRGARERAAAPARGGRHHPWSSTISTASP